ncbi:AhpC/TSA family protein [Klebsiella michiganensis]|uniref:thioredoxin-dependent peroxiredoxin n=1 Tax=Klebsiella michiganensis TaxID=1134687 RepID=A0A6P1UYT8_9ENTR|nr:peroxiredoxin-like family protein [Klebsiella michiganensis]QHS47553.1 AhpC/TSA family protein [Klebsiella michiganensis]HDX8940794.1 AhpC/TSA family protein [Klebsiella michiganensis]
MKLQEKFQHIQQGMIQQVPENILNAFAQSLGELMEQNLEAHALKIGDTAPDFTLPSSNGKQTSLYEVLKENSVVLSFFRGNWCPFCMAELSHYQEAINNKIVDSAAVIAISPQTVALNNAATEENGLQFNVLSDKGNKIAEQYGLVFTLQENIRDIYKGLGADLVVFNGDTTYQLPIPATYIIGKDKKVLFASVNTNYMERADVYDISSKL